jgi:hypothetical protein
VIRGIVIEMLGVPIEGCGGPRYKKCTFGAITREFGKNRNEKSIFFKCIKRFENGLNVLGLSLCDLRMVYFIFYIEEFSAKLAV